MDTCAVGQAEHLDHKQGRLKSPEDEETSHNSPVEANEPPQASCHNLCSAARRIESRALPTEQSSSAQNTTRPTHMVNLLVTTLSCSVSLNIRFSLFPATRVPQLVYVGEGRPETQAVAESVNIPG